MHFKYSQKIKGNHIHETIHNYMTKNIGGESIRMHRLKIPTIFKLKF